MLKRNRKWAIKFNVSKFNFIVFCTRKYDNSIFLLNNSKINYTDKFKYLSLTFSPNLNMSEFFIDKFQNLKLLDEFLKNPVFKIQFKL
jgi:hypothetical protein